MRNIKASWQQKTDLEKFVNFITTYKLFVGLIIAILSLVIATGLISGMIYIVTAAAFGILSVVGFTKNEDKALTLGALPVLLFCYLSLSITFTLSSLLQPLHITDLTAFIAATNAASVLIFRAIKHSVYLAWTSPGGPILYRLANYLLYGVIAASFVLVCSPLILPAAILHSVLLVKLTAPFVIKMLNLVGAGGALILNITGYYIDYIQTKLNLKKIRIEAQNSVEVQRLGISKEASKQLAPEPKLAQVSISPNTKKTTYQTESVTALSSGRQVAKKFKEVKDDKRNETKSDNHVNQFDKPSKIFISSDIPTKKSSLKKR